MSDPRPCGHCGNNIAGDACSCPCGSFYHPGCISLAVSKSTGKRKCCSHRPNSRSVSPTPPLVTIESISQLLENHYVKAKKESEEFITNKLGAIQNDIASLNNTLSSNIARIDDAVDRIENLESQVLEIRSSDKTNQHMNEGHISSQCLAEISDRLQRKHNLVLFGCQEAHVDGKTNNSDILKLDTVKVNEFLKSFYPPHNNQDILIKRIGNYKQNLTAPRPIRIIFSEEQSRAMTLQAYWTWRKTEQNPSRALYLSQDRTLIQRQQHRETMKILLERRSAGETNLKIKEIRGESKIVKSQSTTTA